MQTTVIEHKINYSAAMRVGDPTGSVPYHMFETVYNSVPFFFLFALRISIQLFIATIGNHSVNVKMFLLIIVRLY